MENISIQLAGALAESLGSIFVLIIPIGLIYGKLIRKYTWLTIGAAIPIAAILNAIAGAAVGSVNQYTLLIAAAACIIGIELAHLFVTKKKRPGTAA